MNRFSRLFSIIICLSILLGLLAACAKAPEETVSGEAESLFSTVESSSATTEKREETEGTEQGHTTDSVALTEAETETKVSEVQSTADETESSTTEGESESVTFETELVSDLVSFVDYNLTSRGYHDLKKDGDIAMSFTVPDGYIKTLYLNLTDNSSYTECSVDVSIYRFDQRYDLAVKTEPVYNEYITSTLRTYTIDFEDGQIGAGKYLLVLSYVEVLETETLAAIEALAGADGSEATESETVSGTDETDSETEFESENETETDAKVDPPAPEPVPEKYTKVIRDACWQPKNLNEEYKNYAIKTYIDGKLNKKYALCGGIVIVHGVEAQKNEAETEQDDADNVEKDERIAKVILLGGQSNATGATVNSYLQKNVSAEEYQKYLDGFSNVKILYVNGSTSGGFHITTTTNTFVDTKIGQGYRATNFGPELGLAAYLSEAFPDETFYIIKYAIGGSSLYGLWNPLDSEKRRCLDEFYDTVEQGLSLLEDEGLLPEIIAFLWMQGESDASTLYRAHEYYSLQAALVESIRDEYVFYAPLDGIAFVDAAISNSGFWASYYMVNECKRLYSLESDLNYYIDTNAHGMTTLYENGDLAHYDSLSMLLLGRLYGEKIAEILK